MFSEHTRSDMLTVVAQVPLPAHRAGAFDHGDLLGLSPSGWPLVLSGMIKGVYDRLLLATFADVPPPEEAWVRG